MKKTIIDKCSGWEYALNGEQYYPTGRVVKNGVMTPAEMPEDNAPEEGSRFLGIWAQRHLNYIRRHKKSLYLDLYMSGRLNAYLAEINAQAEDLFLRTVKEMAALESVTEKLKAEDQMEWVGRMNSIRSRAEEIVFSELVCC